MYNKDKTLIIIGNGFDLLHGLPTRFSDFAKYLKGEDKKAYDEIKKYFSLDEASE